MNAVIRLSPPHHTLPAMYCVRRPKKEHTVKVPERTAEKRAVIPHEPLVCIVGFQVPTTTTPNVNGLEPGKP